MTSSSSVANYLASLPNGLGSYPGCQQKAQILRQFVTTFGSQDLFALLPAELIDLARDPPPPTEWIPEVHATAVYLAQRDVLGSDQAFYQHCYTMNRRLLSSPLYRVLFAVAAPERILRGAAERWGKLHRGTELRARRVEAYEAVVRLSAPANLIPQLMCRAYGSAYQVAVELAGGRDVSVDCIEITPTGFTYKINWR